MIITLLLILLILYILRFLLVDDRYDKSVPILPWRLPVIGHLHLAWLAANTGSRNVLERNLKLSLKYGTYYSVLPYGGMRINVQDPESMKHILKDNFDNYVIPPFRSYLTYELFGQGIFMVNGEAWKGQRKLSKPLFHKSSRIQMVPIYQKHTRVLLDHFENALKNKQTVTIQDLFKRLTLDTFGEIGLGVDIGSLKNPVEFSELFDWTQKEIALNFRNPLRKYFTNKTWKRNIEIMDKFVYDIIDKRRKTKDNEKGDILAQLFSITDDEGKGLSDKIIRDFLFNIIIAGRDTTAVLLTWTFCHFSLNPAVEKRVIEEIQQVLGSKNPSFDTCSELRYLTMVLKETLRLYPPAFPINAKDAVKADTLPNGVKVAPGQCISLNVYSLHRRPDYWGDDANEFRPERWETPLKHNFQFIPFLEGPRICLGMNMALEEAKVVIAMILNQGFRLRLVPGEDTSFLASFIMASRTGLRMEVQKMKT